VSLLYYRQRHLLVLSLCGIIHLHGCAVRYLAGSWSNFSLFGSCWFVWFVVIKNAADLVYEKPISGLTAGNDSENLAISDDTQLSTNIPQSPFNIKGKNIP
jgi:hypothetical protein